MNTEDTRDNRRDKHYEDLPWKAWGSWFSWGSPVGMGIFFISIGAFICLLHLAHIIH